jgi:hypothetical protein
MKSNHESICPGKRTTVLVLVQTKDPRERALLSRWFCTDQRRITPQVDHCLSKSGIREGLSLVSAMHITASVFINDDERDLHQD